MKDEAVLEFFNKNGHILVDEDKLFYNIMLIHNSGYKGGIVLRYYYANFWYIEKENEK